MVLQVYLLRTGSIGNRDAETLINTLVEPKRSLLGDLRRELISLGFSEETGFDAINIESFVSYSFSGSTRFIFKHKWNLVVVLIIYSEAEKELIVRKFPKISNFAFARNEEDGTIWTELDPKTDRELILQLANRFLLPEEKK
ncbi:MAG: hypothetical protein ACRECH_07765 [Nitrososphaerales archaeon]